MHWKWNVGFDSCVLINRKPQQAVAAFAAKPIEWNQFSPKVLKSLETVCIRVIALFLPCTQTNSSTVWHFTFSRAAILLLIFLTPVLFITIWFARRCGSSRIMKDKGKKIASTFVCKPRQQYYNINLLWLSITPGYSLHSHFFLSPLSNIFTFISKPTTFISKYEIWNQFIVVFFFNSFSCCRVLTTLQINGPTFFRQPRLKWAQFLIIVRHFVKNKRNWPKSI